MSLLGTRRSIAIQEGAGAGAATGARTFAAGVDLGPPNCYLRAVAGVVKAKKKCCGSNPRCKRCAVVLKRLHKAGLAEHSGGRYYVVGPVKKKKLKKARAR